jgi:membrane protease YdiL (CAAX protease family)
MAGLAGAVVVGVVLGGMQQDLSTDVVIIWGLVGQYSATLAAFLLVARRREVGQLGLSTEPKDILYVGVGMLSQIVVALLLYPLVIRLFPDGRPPQEISGIITSPDTTTLLKLSLFVAAVLLAPLFEELLFRGVLLRGLLRRGRNLAIVASSLLFAAIHIPGLSTEQFLASAVVVLPPLVLLGVALAMLTLRTGRIGPAIFLHSGWNLVAALVLLIPPELLEQLEQMG